MLPAFVSQTMKEMEDWAQQRISKQHQAVNFDRKQHQDRLMQFQLPRSLNQLLGKPDVPQELWDQIKLIQDQQSVAQVADQHGKVMGMIR